MAKDYNFHARLTDIMDREMLGFIWDHSDPDGFADTATIANALWPGVMENGSDKKKAAATRAVGSRLSWMRRYGVVERYEPKHDEPWPPTTRWALSPDGESFLQGKLSSPAERALDSLDSAGMVLALHRLTELDHGDVVHVLMRRAWQYGHAQYAGRR